MKPGTRLRIVLLTCRLVRHPLWHVDVSGEVTYYCPCGGRAQKWAPKGWD